MFFEDRRAAGRFLASSLSDLRTRPNVVVLALPRGGVPVGYEVARSLDAPLDIFVVRKLGVPGHEELAMGAIASGGIRLVSWDLVRQLGIPDQIIEAVAAREQRELERREREYRDGRPPIDVRGRTVVLVDDGLATGASMRAAVEALRAKHPAQIIVAVPVAAAATCAEFESEVDQVVCGITPQQFLAVGQWYQDFSPTTDVEVRELLRRAESFGRLKAA